MATSSPTRHLRRCSETVCFRRSSRPIQQGDLAPAIDPDRKSSGQNCCDAQYRAVDARHLRSRYCQGRESRRRNAGSRAANTGNNPEALSRARPQQIWRTQGNFAHRESLRFGETPEERVRQVITGPLHHDVTLTDRNAQKGVLTAPDRARSSGSCGVTLSLLPPKDRGSMNRILCRCLSPPCRSATYSRKRRSRRTPR